MPVSIRQVVPPLAGDYDGFTCKADGGVYSIIKDDLVWFEPEDAVRSHYVHPEEYPADIVEEFMRRERLLKHKPAEDLRALAGGNAISIRFAPRTSSKEIFYASCMPNVWEAARGGQRSVELRLLLEDDDRNRLKQADLDGLRHAAEEVGLWYEPEEPVLMGDGQRHYLPFTLTWKRVRP